MKRNPLISPEKPVALMSGVYPEYTQQGIAIDSGRIIVCRSGHAVLRVNFQRIEERANTIVVLFKGDVIMVEEHSDDFALDFLVIHPSVYTDVFARLDGLSPGMLDQARSATSAELAHFADALLLQISLAMDFVGKEDFRQVIVYQLCFFFTAWKSFHVGKGTPIGTWRNHQDELFFRFIHLLTKDYRKERTVSYYADSLCITTKYLTNIVLDHTGKAAKQVIDEYAIMQIRLSLISSDRSVSDIARDYQFSSLAFFCDYFKRHVGATPQQFRVG